ncbi:hypothetical protein CDA63_11430 [Hymenobacter amundsenii]|uniref:PepSY domain-containing protein n=2 Tax=Hymenobacter amundsenii TaxID=2006685 RepID=A0A246FKC2_9BACT|nr:hypothetical protein CDA63_11430 [Hymenobacter amundsenii]
MLGSCQRPETATDTPASAAVPVTTEAAARAAVGSYVQALPEHDLYQTDSASVMEAGAQFQVLVPRTDWAGRMPNKAAFNVDKQTGAVTEQLVK